MMKKTWVACLVSLAIGALHLACSIPDVPQSFAKPVPIIIEPTVYPGGVYYFPTTGGDYRASLSSFLKAHPEFDCHYFGADDGWVETRAGPRMRTIGHTIVCTDTAVDAQNEPVR